MTVVVKCKQCGKELRAKDRYAGMPTRCPRCETINRLPELPPAASPKMAVPPKKVVPQKTPKPKPPARATESDACKVCGKPIRGKAERFTDVHGVVYHLGCYQQQAGDAPEDACRICRKGFQTAKERVKDVVGFYYHRKCYQEELERQRLAASGTQPPEKSDDLTAKATTKPKPDPKPATEDDDWDLTPDEEDDWNLEGEADDGWMRPDPDELEVKEEEGKPSTPKAPSAKPPAKLPAKPVNKPAGNPLARKGQSKPVHPGSAAPARKSGGMAEKPATGPGKTSQPPARPSTSGPNPPKPGPARPAASSSPSKGAAKATPAASSNTTAGRKKATQKAKPLRRAKPIEERSAPAADALPEGLELLPGKPKDPPEELGLLPLEPEEEIIEGLEIVEDGPAVPVAKTVSPAAPSSPPSPPSGFSFGDGADPLSDLQPLDDVAPFGAPSPRVQGDPFAAAVASEPLQGDVFGSIPGRPARIGSSRSNSDNSIPTWLWAVMGVGVAVVVIMLLSSVVSVIWSSGGNERQVANSDPTDESVTPEDADSREEDARRFDEEVRQWEEDTVQGDGFLPDDRPPQPRPPHYRPPQPDWPPQDGGPRGQYRVEPPKGEAPPDTLLNQYREFRRKTKNADGSAWLGIGFAVLIGLAIYLGVSALALRFSCSICGEPRAPELRIVGICVCQLLAAIFFLAMTAALDRTLAAVINFPLTCAANIALVRFVLPTTNGRAVAIAVCHVIMSAVVAFVLVFVVVFLLLMAVASMRGVA
jgi:phage FluMu protein Com